VLVLGLIWQIVRLQLLSNVSYQNPAVQILADEEQSPRASFSGEEFPESQKITSTRTSSKMTPEAVLLKWVNYHLKKSGSAVRVRNFSTDFKVIEFIVFAVNLLT
jgi:plastin-3